MKTKPINEIRIGTVKAATWQNQVGDIVRHNVTFTRIYKEGDQWKTSESFGRDELPRLILAAQKAYEALFQTPQEEPVARRA
jgi:hypothetical protein